jgi:hypothetical protein
MISPIQQFVHHEDGTISLKGRPGVRVDVIEQQGHATARDIQKELDLPTYYEQWQELAEPIGLSRRQLQFIVADESATRFPGSIRLQPRKIVLPHSCYLEFGHRSFIVGVVTSLILVDAAAREELKQAGLDIPSYVEGDCIVGTARLFDSPLASKAWEALQRGIFSHTCPLLFRPHTAPLGTGRLVEVSLTTDDFPGCPGARILKAWEN